MSIACLLYWRGMKKQQKWSVLTGGAILIVIVLLVVASRRPGKLDEFARCLSEKRATFYGAFWCPHCQRQKTLFGRSARLLPYIECSTPDGKGQTLECKDKNITGYPTWIFADDSREAGEVSLQTLAEKTNCVLPK